MAKYDEDDYPRRMGHLIGVINSCIFSAELDKKYSLNFMTAEKWREEMEKALEEIGYTK